MKYQQPVTLLFVCLLIGLITAKAQTKLSQPQPPNFIIILADDLGYGDLGCYGHPTILTPNLDKMAKEGMRFTQFYAGADVCSPSRAAILTGRLPIRYGLAGTKGHDVFFPNAKFGLPLSEITIAEALKGKGYQTAIIGKWHLGDSPEYLPLNQGFDHFFGIPYSNDMLHKFFKDLPLLPLYRDTEVIEREPDQRLLTKRYTENVISFIEKNKANPFFIYYANNAPHVPLHASKDFEGKSKRGLYGDVVQEFDWSIGQILKTLQNLNIAKNTLVVFTSDNGPWLIMQEKGGSAGLLKDGKGSTYEGGIREPAIFWWPGTIKPDQVNTALAATMDLFPTFLELAHIKLPADRKYDGVDIMPLLTGQKKEVRDFIYYYNLSELYAIRKGPWKAHFITHQGYSKEPPVEQNPPLLYNIAEDPSEKYEVGKAHPEIIEELEKEYKRFTSTIKPVPNKMQ